jgi:cell division protein FtsW (lipid II flippase)
MGAMRVERTTSDSFTAGHRQRPGIVRRPARLLRPGAGRLGLLMAYTNSIGAPLAPGSTFTRGLIWFAVAIVVFVAAAAFDYRWLRTLRWLVYLVNIGLLI